MWWESESENDNMEKEGEGRIYWTTKCLYSRHCVHLEESLLQTQLRPHTS